MFPAPQLALMSAALFQNGGVATVRPPLETLVPRAVSGEVAALQDLVAQLLPRVRNLVRYLVPRDADVDDLTQEALLVVLDGLPSYRGEGSFTGWSDRVAMRSVFRNLRRWRKEPSRPDVVELPEDAAFVASVADAEGYLTRRHVVRLLDALSPDQRYVVVMHHVLELTVPEIAAELRLSPETVRSRLRLARNNLRQKSGTAAEGPMDEEAS